MLVTVSETWWREVVRVTRLKETLDKPETIESDKILTEGDATVDSLDTTIEALLQLHLGYYYTTL